MTDFIEGTVYVVTNGSLVNYSCIDTADDEDEGGIPEVFLLIPQLSISLLGWLRTLLALNRMKWHITMAEGIGLVLFVSAGLVRCVTALSTRRAGIVLQVFSAVVASLMVWAAFIVIFNNSLKLPTFQQWQSMILVIAVSALWEAHSRIMVNLSE